MGRTISAPSTTPAADDLIRLADYLKIDRFHLLGAAAGGFVAFDTALSYLNRLRSLAVACSIGGIKDEEARAIGRRIRTPEFEALTEDVKELGPEYRSANPDGLRRWLELEKQSRPDGPPQPAQPFKSHITLAAIEKLTMPVLVIAGGADMYAPPTVMRSSPAASWAPRSWSFPRRGTRHIGRAPCSLTRRWWASWPCMKSGSARRSHLLIA